MFTRNEVSGRDSTDALDALPHIHGKEEKLMNCIPKLDACSQNLEALLVNNPDRPGSRSSLSAWQQRDVASATVCATIICLLYFYGSITHHDNQGSCGRLIAHICEVLQSHQEREALLDQRKAKRHAPQCVSPWNCDNQQSAPKYSLVETLYR